MNRRILLLSLALLALAGSLGWLLRQRWLEARAHEQAVLNRPARLHAPAAAFRSCGRAGESCRLCGSRAEDALFQGPESEPGGGPSAAAQTRSAGASLARLVGANVVRRSGGNPDRGKSARAERATAPETPSATSSWSPSITIRSPSIGMENSWSANCWSWRRRKRSRPGLLPPLPAPRPLPRR